MSSYLNIFSPSWWYSWVAGNNCTNLFCHMADYIEKGMNDPKVAEVFGRVWSKMGDTFSELGERTTEIFSRFVESFDFSGKTHVIGKEFIRNFNVLGKDLGEAIKKFNVNLIDGGFEALKHLRYRYLLEIFPFIIGSMAVTLITRYGIQYLYNKAVHNLGRPKLAVEHYKVSRFTLVPRFLKNAVEKVGRVFFGIRKPTAVFNAEISRRITHITKDIENIRKNGGYLQNVLLYGVPGTGKTMISKEIARKAGMNYIFMSGGDLPQYIKRGEHVTEFNKLMDAAEKSSNPTIIFIDEAESLCRKRGKLSQEMLELQNAFLNRTGTQSKKFMLVLATNRRDDLDEAILSRMDYKIHIGLPGLAERTKIVRMYAEQFFSKRDLKTYFSPALCKSIALKTSGFTGRKLYKTINAIYNRKFATNDNKLSYRLINGVISEFIHQEREEQKQTLVGRVYLAFQDVLALITELFARCFPSSIVKRISIDRA